jgi:predicted DNA-binding transcriptional regulator AlpA
MLRHRQENFFYIAFIFFKSIVCVLLTPLIVLTGLSIMRPLATITADEILILFKKYLGLVVTKTAIYNYMKTRNFPQNIGLGSPRLWPKKKVMAWIQHQIKINRG